MGGVRSLHLCAISTKGHAEVYMGFRVYERIHDHCQKKAVAGSAASKMNRSAASKHDTSPFNHTIEDLKAVWAAVTMPSAATRARTPSTTSKREFLAPHVVHLFESESQKSRRSIAFTFAVKRVLCHFTWQIHCFRRLSSPSFG